MFSRISVIFTKIVQKLSSGPAAKIVQNSGPEGPKIVHKSGPATKIVQHAVRRAQKLCQNCVKIVRGGPRTKKTQL